VLPLFTPQCLNGIQVGFPLSGKKLKKNPLNPATRLIKWQCAVIRELEHVEQAYRSIKALDILIRPIFHRIDTRVRAHIFLCMLAYYVEWHLRKALAPLLFEGQSLEEQRKSRGPVLPAQPSINVKKKKTVPLTREGLRIHSFSTLLAKLSSLCRNRCRFRHDPKESVFYQLTQPTPLQKKVFQLLGLFPVR